MTNDKRFFDFLELAPRAPKPRRKGLLCIGDEGDPLSWVKEMLEAWGDYVDSVKFVPALLMMPQKVVEKRVRLYRDLDLDVALDDPIFAIAYYLGKAEELLRKVKAAQYVRNHPGEVCPAKWEEGEETLAPSIDLVGKIEGSTQCLTPRPPRT